VARTRGTQGDPTVKRRVDVEEAFSESPHEQPTRPAVHALVPLDAVPVLAVARTELRWNELGDVARQLLLRVDGRRTAMSLVSLPSATPHECSRELASLARRGILRLAPTVSDEMVPLEIDLSMV
jgi:hypothetical protein